MVGNQTKIQVRNTCCNKKVIPMNLKSNCCQDLSQPLIQLSSCCTTTAGAKAQIKPLVHRCQLWLLFVPANNHIACTHACCSRAIHTHAQHAHLLMFQCWTHDFAACLDYLEMTTTADDAAPCLHQVKLPYPYANIPKLKISAHN